MFKNKQVDQNFGNKEKRLGAAQKITKKTLTKQKLVSSKQKVPKRSRSDFFCQVKYDR